MICWRNGKSLTTEPIPIAEGMAQRASVAAVCGNRGQKDWRGRDQPSCTRSRCHPKNDSQGNTRTGGWSVLSARGAVTQARGRTQERYRKVHGAGNRFGGDAGAERRSAEFRQMDEQVGEQADENSDQPIP